MKVARPYERPTYEPSKRRLTFPSGAVATTFTGEEPDQIRGPQFDTAWIDELAKFQYPQAVWDNLEFALRLGIYYYYSAPHSHYQKTTKRQDNN
jgi:phage terminase large subunit-like protein